MTLLVAIVAGGMIMLGVNGLVALGLVLVFVWPPAAIAALVVGVIWEVAKRRSERLDASETAFLTGLAAAVSAGSTLRDVIADAQSPFVSAHAKRLCRLGRPMTEIAPELALRMPATGRELAVMLAMSETAGARIVGALHQLAEHAEGIEQRKRDQQVAAAQAKFSSLVVGVVPLVAGLALLLVRGVPEPGGALILIPMALGAAMMVAGAATVLAVAHRVVT
ncbi:MAG: type II secretion system F family protein [Acidimicrobiia bacterium]